MVGLAEGKHGEAAPAQRFVAGDTDMAAAVVNHVFVHLVGQHEDSAALNQFREPVEIGDLQHRTAGVVRAVDDDQTGSAADRLSEPIPVDPVIRQAQWQVDCPAAGELHGGFVTIEGGVEDDDFIAGMHDGLHRVENRFGGARGDGYLGLRVGLITIIRRYFLGDALAQRQNPGHGRILVAAPVEPLGNEFPQPRRTIKIRIPLGKIDRPMFSRHARHDGEDRGADLRELAVHGFDSEASIRHRRVVQFSGRREYIPVGSGLGFHASHAR